MKRLPPEKQDAALLWLREGNSLTEVAAAIEVDVDEVSSLIRKLRYATFRDLGPYCQFSILSSDDQRHGTDVAFTELQCRCTRCMEGVRRRGAEERREKRGGQFKSCAWPGCSGRCPEAYRWCTWCISDRWEARLAGTINGEPITDAQRAALHAETVHKIAQKRRWQANQAAWMRSPAGQKARQRYICSPKGQEVTARYKSRLSELRRWERDYREWVRWRNYEYRRAAMAQLREEASAELLALIAEQQSETNRVRRTSSDPWMMRSLDAPLPGHDDMTLADALGYSSGYWDDPTGDLACALAMLPDRAR